MSDRERMEQEVRRLRDEVALKIHLASMDLRREWNELESEWNTFRARAGMEETEREVGEAAGRLADELKKGYRRLRDALKD